MDENQEQYQNATKNLNANDNNIQSPSNINTLNIKFLPPNTYQIVSSGGHTVSRPNSNSCFVYDQNPQVNTNETQSTGAQGLGNTFSNKAQDLGNVISDVTNPLHAKEGGKLKTKKRRITKKHVQKRRPFKSRSKK